EDGAHQDAAVGAAGCADLALHGHARPDEVLGDRVEIVEAALAVFTQRGLVPSRPIFAAAADVGEDIGIALLDPEQSERTGAVRLAGQVAWGLRASKAAIGMDQ